MSNIFLQQAQAIDSLEEKVAQGVRTYWKKPTIKNFLILVFRRLMSRE